MPLTNTPSEGLPVDCTCVLMAPGTLYEMRALNPDCRVHTDVRRPRLTRHWRSRHGD